MPLLKIILKRIIYKPTTQIQRLKILAFLDVMLLLHQSVRVLIFWRREGRKEVPSSSGPWWGERGWGPEAIHTSLNCSTNSGSLLHNYDKRFNVPIGVLWRSPGVRHRVIWYTETNISEEITVSIFKTFSNLKMEPTGSSRMAGSYVSEYAASLPRSSQSS